MTRKKSNRDARGYCTSNVVQANKPDPSVVGKYSKRIQVSTPAQVELSCLLDDMKKHLLWENIHYEEKKSPVLFSMTDKKIVNKISRLNEQLLQYGFNKDQIVKAFVGILSGEGITSNDLELSLDSLLDWFCMNLSTEELPKLFTECEAIEAGDHKLSVVHVEETTEEKGRKNITMNALSLPSAEAQHVPDVGLPKPEDPSGKRVQNDGEQKYDTSLTNKKWILEHYQFQDEEEESQMEGCNELTSKTENEPSEQVRSADEMRLENIEKQIEMDHNSLNDDVANYMRSKYEIEEIRKRLKKSQQQAKGLRAKIAKKKAKEMEQSENNVECSDDTTYDEEEYCGGMQDFFTQGASNSEDKITPVSLSAVHKNEEPVISAEIPLSWTGKTPKELLIERCQKRKISHPKFSKIAGTRNGCAVKVKLSPSDEKTITHEGPFTNFHQAQQFTATLALYQMEPHLPLDTLLPQPFKDLWISWVDEQDASKKQMATREENDRMARSTELLKTIQKYLTTKKESVKEYKDCSNESIPPDDWDNLSIGSNNDQHRSFEQQPTPKLKSIKSKMMQEAFKKKQLSRRYQTMKESRKSLPIYEYRSQIVNEIKSNPVTVLCAETGAGKTTQCPQFILEEALENGYGDEISVVCTQPRRISAISVAERVSEEMDEDVGVHVGYQVRMESKTSNETKLVFCTTGVVLRRLQEDPNLMGVTHIIVDECHERQWQIDFLLIALRQILKTTRTDLKVILMSATLDTNLLCSFFNNAPLLKIPGRTFPVSIHYLEDIFEATRHIIEENSRCAKRTFNENPSAPVMIRDGGGQKRKTFVPVADELDSITLSDDYDGYSLSTRRSMEMVNEEVINYELIEDLLTLLVLDNHRDEITIPPSLDLRDYDGSILIFLPGLGEIKVLNDMLNCNPCFSKEDRFQIIPMHSSLSAKDQKRAFMPSRKGCRKIILTTNICETSVTIPDCVCVIDTGFEKLQVQDHRSSTPSLVTRWCSKASANQRAGRAGRIRAGVCCKLYSSQTAKFKMKNQTIPELLRVPLEEVCLTILAGKLSSNCMDFLLQAPQPPTEKSVASALQVLQDVGAIAPISEKKTATAFAVITPLGLHLAKLPVHVRLGKILIFGALFGVLDKVLTIVASLSTKSPFIISINDKNDINSGHKVFRHPTSDFLTFCNMWDAYTKAATKSPASARRFCTKHSLNHSTLIEIGDLRKHFFQLLSSIGFISHSVKSLDSAQASQHNKYGSKEEIINAAICAGLYPNVAHVMKQSNSVAIFSKNEQLWFHKSSTNHGKKLMDSEWVIFQEKFATNKTYISATSVVDPFILLLFGRSVVKHVERKVIIDDWIEFDIAAQVGVMFRELKYVLSKIFEMYMKSHGHDPRFDIVVDGICSLLSSLKKNSKLD